MVVDPLPASSRIVPVLVSVPLMASLEPAPSSTVPALVTVPPLLNVAAEPG